VTVYQYDPDFYAYINKGAEASAERVVSAVLEHLSISSVADFGCGQGAWLAVWKRKGISTVLGVDGDYVNRDALRITREEFAAADLTAPIDLERRFDLVQCLEVAEHLPAAAADSLVNSLTAHAPMVLFSAAPPGQGGENHINEQPYAYWRDRFTRKGFVPLDLVRPQVRNRQDVEPWYRYNTLLYVERKYLDTLPESVRRLRISDNAPIPDVSPLWYRMRKGFISVLPVGAMTRLAVLKKQLALASRGSAAPPKGPV